MNTPTTKRKFADAGATAVNDSTMTVSMQSTEITNPGVMATASRQPLRFSLLAGAILLASGCAVGPDYESALDAAPAQHTFVTTDVAALSTAELQADWWQLYNDTALNALVEEALSANADLRAAEANLRRVDAIWRETRTQQLPSTSVDASETYSRQNFFFGPTPLTVQNNVYNVGLNIAYHVDLVGFHGRLVRRTG